MSSLGTMKARVASELRRSDLTTQIASAISTAIQAYQDERYETQESRTTTFPTVADTEFYDTNLSTLVQIDYVKLILNESVYTLRRNDPSTMETLSNVGSNTGQPSSYCWYGNEMRLYPIPDAVYTIRVAGIFSVAEPASDSETGNFWMTTAERLIRSRAKWELATHVLMDADLKAAMDGAVADAERELYERSRKKLGTGYTQTMAF